MQSQKQQNDLYLFPRQTIQYHGNPSLCHLDSATTNAEEAEVEWFYNDLQDLLELTPKKKKMSFHLRGLEWVNLTQMIINYIYYLGKNPLEEME